MAICMPSALLDDRPCKSAGIDDALVERSEGLPEPGRFDRSGAAAVETPALDEALPTRSLRPLKEQRRTSSGTFETKASRPGGAVARIEVRP